MIKTNKGQHLYSGKSKSIFATEDSQKVILRFLDDLTAFDGKKKAVCSRKGVYNNLINAHLMQRLTKLGLPIHHQGVINERESVVWRLNMLRIEFVVRNIAAGSLCKRLGIDKGIKLEPPVCECFLKDDGLGDPLINESHIRLLKLASKEQVNKGRELSLEVNRHLQAFLAERDIDLVDFKLEFGMREVNGKSELYIGDEITPDSCRLWDKKSRLPFDKDIFRFNLGDIGEAYRNLMTRLGIDDSGEEPQKLKTTPA